jgi:4-hydroxybenzoate polyprenyltransferase
VPFLDTLISAGIYVVPAVVGCSIWGGTSVSALAILAGILWSIAMHAYSAIPDIEADTHAHIATVATFLGSRNTLYFCGVCFGLAAVLAYSLCGLVALFLGVVYLAIIVVALMKNSPKTIFKIYTIFPWINAAAGMILFFSALFQSTVR